MNWLIGTWGVSVVSGAIRFTRIHIRLNGDITVDNDVPVAQRIAHLGGPRGILLDGDDGRIGLGEGFAGGTANSHTTAGYQDDPFRKVDQHVSPRNL